MIKMKCNNNPGNKWSLLDLFPSGHVGVPMPCNVVKLVDVEEMNYFASNGEGEVR